MYTLYREEADETRTVVAYIDNQLEIGCAIDEDRQKLDYEAKYLVVWDKKGEQDDTL